MKFLIASDLHGSAKFTRELLAAFDREQAELLVLLGDLYYHGVRNPLPEGYAPPEVAELLNARRDRLLVVRGNCDSDVDLMVSQFPIVKTRESLRTDGIFTFATATRRALTRSRPCPGTACSARGTRTFPISGRERD